MTVGELLLVLKGYDPDMLVEGLLGTNFYEVGNWESDGEAVYLLLGELS